MKARILIMRKTKMAARMQRNPTETSEQISSFDRAIANYGQLRLSKGRTHERIRYYREKMDTPI